MTNDIEKIKAVVSAKMGVPAEILSGNNVAEIAANGKALAIYRKKQTGAYADKKLTTGEQFERWVRQQECDNISDDPELDIIEQEIVNEYSAPSGEGITRAQFAEWFDAMRLD